MIYAVFATKAEAQAYADAATETLPRGVTDTTACWDTPRECVDGRWAVTSTDGDGESDVEFVGLDGTEEL